MNRYGLLEQVRQLLPLKHKKCMLISEKFISNRYNDNLANNVSILYGGSVKPSNVKEIFKGSDVNGGLIGGASLNADDFMAIVNAF